MAQGELNRLKTEGGRPKKLEIKESNGRRVYEPATGKVDRVSKRQIPLHTQMISQFVNCILVFGRIHLSDIQKLPFNSR